LARLSLLRRPYFSSRLKVFFNHVEEMLARLASGDAVGFIGIDHQPELFAGIDSAIDHLHSVLKCTLSSPVPWADQ